MNEPVAYLMVERNDGNSYIQTGVPTRDEKISHQPYPLYTHPVKELNDGGEPVKNATYWKRQYNLMATQNDNLKSGLYHANEQIKYLEFYPIKELTDEEINEVWYEDCSNADSLIEFARAILRKAQE